MNIFDIIQHTITLSRESGLDMDGIILQRRDWCEFLNQYKKELPNVVTTQEEARIALTLMGVKIYNRDRITIDKKKQEPS